MKGKEFYFDGNKRFEGEYLNGLRWNGKFFGECENELLGELKDGKGIGADFDEYHNGDEIIFIGEYLNGKKHGNGEEYFEEGFPKYKGKYLNGLRHGKGKEYHKEYSILIFDGEYLNGKRWNGKGIEYDEYYNEILYKGEYLNGKRCNGEGIEYDEHYKKIFEGQYLNGKKINRKK